MICGKKFNFIYEYINYHDYKNFVDFSVATLRLFLIYKKMFQWIF